ncbi:MAG: proline--tRNA ligase [Elusimicrobia bacterium]|nr:proline--tRNA ligase [Elusimicrobiota bacterium]
MRLSRFLLPTLKDLPSDADTVSARLMLRAGMIRKVASGLYEWLPVGLRVLRRVERIVREEMDRIGGQEVWLPVVQPKNLWEETGRWQQYGKEMLRLRDRKDTEFCLAPTAEEVITDLVRREVRSYRELPLLLYQFGTKFRDEIRPRFGVMRSREFYMKDAYSFHADDASAEATYRDALDAYTRIFQRCGLKFRPVEADTGTIGGNFSHEFMVLADTGEETIAACSSCGYAANVERAECGPSADGGLRPEGQKEGHLPMDEVATPGVGAVEAVSRLLNVPASKIIKTVFYVADGKPVVALVRGDHELNEHKLKRLLGAKLLFKAGDEVYRQTASCEPGFAGPVGLNADVVADHSVMAVTNGVTGANKTDFHRRNVNPGRDFTPARVGDLRQVIEKDPCPKCKSPLCFFKGIEVGHAFKLGTKYSGSMDAGFLNEKGTKSPFIMGCYGIGVSRVVAAAIEQSNDADGIVWPPSLAPFDALILPLNTAEPAVMAAAERLEKELAAAGLDVLVDDRDQRAGVKFKDADLLGIPWRVTVGEKKLALGQVEIKARNAKDSMDVPLDQAAGILLKKRG